MPIPGARLALFFSLALMLASGPAGAVEVTRNYVPLGAEVQFLTDPTGTLTLEHLLADPSANPFTAARDGRPDSSFTPVWLKFELEFSEAARERRYYLFARNENLYDVRLYRPDGEGGYSEWITGNRHPASTREVDSPHYGFYVETTEAPQTIYLRYVGGPGANQFPWDLIEEDTFRRSERRFYTLDVAAFSAIASLLVFNLFIALSLRKAEYLFYSCYVASVTMSLATLDGLGFYYLWPETPALNSRALHSFNLVSAATRLLTILAFLDVANFAPRIHRVAMSIVGAIGAGLVVLNILGIDRLPPFSPTLFWAVGILFGFAICGYAIWKRRPLAIPLFISLLIPSASAILQAVLTVSDGGVGILEMQLAKLGFVIHVIMFSLCLAAQIKIETEYHILALHDTLTGLPGMSLLQERFDLVASFCRRQGTKAAALFIDLDGFKAVNDTMGHAAGDQLLVQVAGRIQVELRRTDTVARIGGDEFVLLLSNVKEDDSAIHVAQKLLATISEPYHLDAGEARVSASIGIALFPDAGEDLETLLSVADGAMYDSKRQGKNAFTLVETKAVPLPSRLGSTASRRATPRSGQRG